MKTVFSGVAPSGIIHIGNYLGAIRQWLELQKNNKCIFCVVDYHAMTISQSPEKLREKILEVAMIYLTAGIDPKKSVIFVQSDVAEHAELTWILNTLAKISDLELMTQFKDKAKRFRKKINIGLFDYPVLMAADILLYKTNVVPVGHDQRQHVEFTRAIARRFNKLYGETFVIPELMIRKESAKIMGLDDPTKKMSKSAENPYNYLALTDEPSLIKEKIKRAVTDSGKDIVYDLKNKKAISNLLTICSLIAEKSIKQLEKECHGKGYAEFKKGLAEVIINFLSPFQKKFKKLKEDQNCVRRVLKDGAQKARAIAQAMMIEVKKKVGLL